MKSEDSLIKRTTFAVLICLFTNFLVSSALAGNASITLSKPGMAVYHWDANSSAISYLSNGGIRIGDWSTDTITPVYRFEIPKVGTISNINVTIHVNEHGSLSGGTEVYIGPDSQGNISVGLQSITYAPTNSTVLSEWIEGESDGDTLADYIEVKFVNSGWDDLEIYSIDVYVEYGTIPDTKTGLIAQYQQIYNIYSVLDGYNTRIVPILNNLGGYTADQIVRDGICKAYSVADKLSKLNGFDVTTLDASSWGSWINLVKDIKASLSSACDLWNALKEFIYSITHSYDKAAVVIDISDSSPGLADATGPAASAVKTLAETWQQAISDGNIDEAEKNNIISNIDAATGKMETLKVKLEAYVTDVFDGDEGSGIGSNGWSDPDEIEAREGFLQLTQPLKVYNVVDNVATEQTYLLKNYIDFLNSVKPSPSGALTVTALANGNGTIAPSGNISVTAGSSKTFSATPNSGYVVDKWLLDGNMVQDGGSSYTICNIQLNHTLSVSFKASAPGTDESNNTYQTAGYLGIIDCYKEYNNLSITSGDVDYYKFTLENTGTAADYVTIYWIGLGYGSSDIDLALGKVNSSGNFVPAHGHWADPASMSWTDQRTETISLKNRAPGDYYVIVFGASGFDFNTENTANNPDFTGTETNNYILVIHGPDSYEDDNTPDLAKIISTDGVAQKHSLSGGSEDTDWIKFILTQDSDVVVQLVATAGDDMNIDLYGPDSSSAYIKGDDIGGSSDSCVISRIGSNYLCPGTYYLNISSFFANDIPQYYLSVFASAASIAPARPTIVSYPFWSNSGQYTISWSSSSRATAYQLERSSNGGGIWSLVYSGPDTSYSESICSGNGIYLYRVKAQNDFGTSDWVVGNLGCLVAMPLPAMPPSIYYPTNSTGGQYAIRWSSAAGAVSYQLERSSDGGAGWTQIYSGSNTVYSERVTNGTYRYRVRSTNCGGASAWNVGSWDCIANWAYFGPIIAWGDNSAGQCNIPSYNDFVSIAAGSHHSVGLRFDGSLAAWGDNSWGDCDVPSGDTFVAISVSGYNSLALKSDCSVVAWGYNSSIPTGNDFVAIAAGWSHSLALKSDGSIIAWGDNSYGQCNAPPGNEYVAIAAGWLHSIALKSDGSLVAWGYNSSGSCDVPSGNDFVTIAAGAYHSLALKSDGSVVTWGGSYLDNQFARNIVAVAAGYYYNLALKSDGSVVACDFNSNGQCNVPGGNKFSGVAAGESYALAIAPAPPAAPVSITYPMSSNTGQYTVSWSPSTNTTSYQLDRSNNGGVDWVQVYSGANTSYLENASNGTYRYRVRATILESKSVWMTGTWDCAVNIPLPSTPCSITYPPISNSGNYTINWPSATGATYYQLERSSDGGAHWNLIYSGSSNSYSEKIINGNYIYRVRAANGGGFSDWFTVTQDCTVVIDRRFMGSLKAWGAGKIPEGNDFVAIAAGGFHDLALTADGSLVAWGYNGYGECDVPSGSDFVAIAAGSDHSLALKSDGSLAGWGDNQYGQCNIPPGNNYVAIAAGWFHNLALKSDGSLITWGANWFDLSNVPQGNDFKAIAAGYSHSLALKSDGSLVAWGSNYYGERNVPLGNNFVAIAAGMWNSVALKSDGSVVQWGDQLGCNISDGNFVAVAAGGHLNISALKSDGSIVNCGGNDYVPSGNNFVAIAIGYDHSLALRSDGSIVVRGADYAGQLNVPAGETFVSVAAGGVHGVALKADGSLVAWGNNYLGECNVPTGNNFMDIAAGGYHSVALKTDGSLVAWGNNYNGECNTPPGNDYVAIAAEGLHSIALKANGSLVAWGYSWHGQGNVPVGNDFVAIAAGEVYDFALKASGSIVAWGGDNYNGECNIPNGNNFVAIATGMEHDIALKTDGSLAAWGSNYVGECNVPTGNNFVDIAAGNYYSLALKSDGSLIAWGDCGWGQCDVPSGKGFIDISTYRHISMAILSMSADLDGNGEENFTDFAILANSWMSQPGQPNWNPACDISDPKDNIIDWKDLEVFAEAWLAGVER